MYSDDDDDDDDEVMMFSCCFPATPEPTHPWTYSGALTPATHLGVKNLLY